MHVLVIEDDREHAEFIEKVLSEAGHSVETVEDGVGGLSRAREDAFDAMVVDRMLPEKIGARIFSRGAAWRRAAAVMIRLSASD